MDSTTTPPTESAPKMVRLYNRGGTTYSHGKFRLQQQSFAVVPEDVANQWLEMFPGSVIHAGEADKSGEAIKHELDKVKIELEAAKRRIVDMEEENRVLAAKVAAPAPPLPASVKLQRRVQGTV